MMATPLRFGPDGHLDMGVLDEAELAADEIGLVDSWVRATRPDAAWDRALDAVLGELRGGGAARAGAAGRAPSGDPPSGHDAPSGHDEAAGRTQVAVGFRRRRLAPAAADDARTPLAEVSRSFRSADGRLSITVEQTGQGHLVVTVTATPAVGPAPWLVALSWESSGARRMVVPLSGREGRPPSARYDLGEADAVTAAATAAPSDLSTTDVTTAFSLIMYGDALRAWQQLADRHDCPGAVRSAVAAHLGR